MYSTNKKTYVKRAAKHLIRGEKSEMGERGHGEKGKLYSQGKVAKGEIDGSKRRKRKLERGEGSC